VISDAVAVHPSEDRVWIVATEIDYALTHVGGTSGLIEKLLARDGLEAIPTNVTAKPFYDSDVVNAALNQQ
jgi:hypothetical protein